MQNLVACLALFGVLALPPSIAWAESGSDPLEEHAIAAAQTPGDHEALAAHYRAMAAEARVDSARHRSMGRAYGGGKQGTRTANFHCKRISAHFASIAMEYEELAKLHEAEARSKK